VGALFFSSFLSESNILYYVGVLPLADDALKIYLDDLLEQQAPSASI
jgi:hypothetical protein